jgi:hypothetical protein
VNQKKKAKKKGWGLKAREEYYRTISQYFLEQRGAPFFLSSQELSLIADWEKMEIPLRVVLEGLRRAVENRRQRPGRRAKFLSLNQCQRFVLESHKQHRERRIGGERRVSQNDLSVKRKKILSEINRFLAQSHGHIKEVNQLFSQLRSDLNRGNWDEEYIERTETQIEEVLVDRATPEERKYATEAVRSEFGAMESEEFDRVVRIRLIKELRLKYQIPYVSPFYF